MNALGVFKDSFFCFTESGQLRKKRLMGSMSFLHIQMRFIFSLKPGLDLCLLRWLKPIRNLFNRFILYGL